MSTEDGRELARKDVALPGADFSIRSANGRVRAQRALLFEVTRPKGRDTQ